MKKNIIKFGIIALVLAVPILSFAAGKDLKSIMDTITGYMANFIKLIIAFAVLTFVWNIYKYFVKADADRAEAGKYVLYSVIGFFIILSIWGLVNIVKNTFNLDNSNPGWPFNTGGSNPAPGFSGGGSYNTGTSGGGSYNPGFNGGGSYNTFAPNSGFTTDDTGGTVNSQFPGGSRSTNDDANDNENRLSSPNNSADTSNLMNSGNQSTNDEANAAEGLD